MKSITTNKLDDGLETVELARKDKSDVRWTGRLLGEVDSDEEAREGGRTNKGRWTRLQLWELEGGAWVAAAIGCSDKPGEIDIGDVEMISLWEKRDDNPYVWIPATQADAKKLTGDQCRTRNGIERRRQAMEFFGWSWLAKKLADKLGWNVVEVIE